MVQIAVDQEQIREFCRKHHIRWMALFGSALREDFRPESDVDVLVEFDPDHVPGLLGMARLARELQGLFSGRPVDLRTPPRPEPLLPRRGFASGKGALCRRVTAYACSTCWTPPGLESVLQKGVE
jgi:predicted nucleotidyltransferase